MTESAVLDNNVIISSIFWEKGNPNKIVVKAIEKKFNNLTSPSMVFELMNVLRRDFNQPEEYIQRQVALLANYSNIVRPKIKLKEIKEDPKDDMILECALEGKANHIVTGDWHLLKLKEFRNIKIVTPKEFLEILGE